MNTNRIAAAATAPAVTKSSCLYEESVLGSRNRATYGGWTLSAADNKQAARDGYEAFSSGDAEGAMANISDSVEWIVGGDSAVAGTYRGKQEVGGFWAQIAEKDFRTEPSEFIADGDKVAVVGSNTVGGVEVGVVDLLTYDGNGQLVRFESFGGENALDQVFPK